MIEPVRPARWHRYWQFLLPLLVFILLAAFLPAEGGYSWDNLCWNALLPLRSYGLDQGMHLISLLGSGIGLSVFAALVLWWFWRVEPCKPLRMRFLAANLGGAILAWPLKFAFARARPLMPDHQSSFDAIGYSFPSGHAMAAIIFYGFLAWLMLTHSGRLPCSRLRWAVLMLVFGSLSGFSRFYLGAHYLSDVLAGFCAGWIWLALCLPAKPFVFEKR